MPLFPTELTKTAFNVGEEFAWLRMDALQVIARLQEKAICVLGIEIWLRGDGQKPVIPTPYVYGWAATQRGHSESEEAYARRTCREAADYVRGFQWDGADESHVDEAPYFCVTTDADLG